MNGKITEKIPYGFMRHEKYGVVVMDHDLRGLSIRPNIRKIR